MPGKEKSVEELFELFQNISTEKTLLQERLDRITEITAAIIYILDADGHFTFVNKAVEEILHFSPDELIGKHFSTIMAHEEYERVSRSIVLPAWIGKMTGPENSPKLFDERRTKERRTRNLEVRLLTKTKNDMRYFIGDVTGIVAVEGAYDLRKLTGAKNKIAGFVGSQGVIFDITRYKKAEKERMDLQRRLFETQKMDALGRLAAKVAHDLNNKLGSIIGCAEIISQDFSSASSDLKMYVETILSASRHASELSNRLMEFSVLDDHNLQEINLNEMIDKVIELVRHTSDQSIQIKRKYFSDHVIISGNPNRLQNSLLNVAINACDAIGKESGQLTFETRPVPVDAEFLKQRGLSIDVGEYVEISVTDTGEGMSDAVKEHLFEPFFTTKDIGSGIGLGLASVFDCMKTHGGFIDVSSEPGKGSRFKLFLPLFRKNINSAGMIL